MKFHKAASPTLPKCTMQLKVLHLALEGLEVDGEHHKQWYLERIVETLGCKKLLISLGSKKGIAP